eukprot:scaffold9637_cov47-Attheya_sp.AAC.3
MEIMEVDAGIINDAAGLSLVGNERTLDPKKPQLFKSFEAKKENCLGKRDKSNAGRIDPKAVDICSVLNERDDYYTTSSCAGRCFLYRGDGIKSHHKYIPSNQDHAAAADNDEKESQGLGFFQRYRVNHDVIRDAQRYFNIATLDPSHEQYDPSGGGDPVRTIGQFDHKKALSSNKTTPDGHAILDASSEQNNETARQLWLRFEPFILHVACRTMNAAGALMAAARPAFKNVGLTAFSSSSQSSKFIVAIWGDEGLDMPLLNFSNGTFLFSGQEVWLQELVNERHLRNWEKIARFVQHVRDMPPPTDADDDTLTHGWSTHAYESSDVAEGETKNKKPRKFDVVGDVAILNTMPPGTPEEREQIGKQIMSQNKAIRVCVARVSSLIGTERSPGEEGMTIIAGAQRNPLISTHVEYGIKCVVDLNHAFFSPRMGPERLRICQQVARGEDVLVLFSGVGMDAMQIAGRTEASSIMAIELNPMAAECARRGQRMLQRNKSVKCVGAADRLQIVEGDVLEILPTLPKKHYDRILAPRPKEGNLDGDLGKGDGGTVFLEALIPLLKEVGGECHWYDFAADHELPDCERTRKGIAGVCERMGFNMEVIHVARVGSIAKRQIRICMDFRLTGRIIQSN